ncbi:Short-chain dehydrogenase/reductase [Mycobacteroides abscessus]|nr:Short-chain dehydrogenase/reductase [Mycobacteroides abscessus]
MNLAEAPKEIEGHGLLKGKAVVVTAAAGTGIGSSTARRALAEGPTWSSPTITSVA